MKTTRETSQGGKPVKEKTTQEEIERLIQESERETLSTDDVFGVLGNQRRRRSLRYLCENSGRTVTLKELAEHVAALENGVDATELTSGQRKRVYIGLYQNHLPKMHELGIVDYDQPRGTVELRDISALEPYLAEADSMRNWIIVATVVPVAVGALVLGVFATGTGTTLLGIAWATLSTIALVLVSALYLNRRPTISLEQ